MKELDIYIENNYEQLRNEFESMLIEYGYNPIIVSEVNDWWEEFCIESFSQSDIQSIYQPETLSDLE